MFPFNWDPQRVGTFPSHIQEIAMTKMFPFNWDPQRVGTVLYDNFRQAHNGSFHSIGIPSEWGQYTKQSKSFIQDPTVSIQLGSPASGDRITLGYVIRVG